MRLVATRKGYVRRLRQMIYKDDVCKCCPVEYKFSWHISHRSQDCTEEIKEWCFDFIGMKVRRGYCPCDQGSNAPTLARKALALWDKGEHRWQEEER